LIVAAIVFAMACQRSGSSGVSDSPVVALVDEEAITLDHLRRAFKTSGTDLSFDDMSEPARAFKTDLLNQLIDQRLLIAEAHRLKLEVSRDELQEAMDQTKSAYSDEDFNSLLAAQQLSPDEWRDRLKKEILIQKLIQRAVEGPVEITDDEIQKYYGEHRKEFAQKETVRARQIMVGSEEEARQVRDRLLAGGRFDELARTQSLSPDRSKGGDLGYFSRGEMPEAFDVVFRMKVGELSPVIKTEYGYHLLTLVEHRPAKMLSETEAAERIRAILSENKREGLYSDWTADLRRKAKITVNYSFLLGATPEAAGKP
jgi:parvulin-like peptidyl-prolyl isomerase